MNHVISYVVGLVVVGACAVVEAQELQKDAPSNGRARALTGEVAYSNPDTGVRNSQTEVINALEAWGEKLQSIVTTSGVGKVPKLDQNAASYLSVLYLYCSVKNGPCPFILETVLDADIALSRVDNRVTCALTNRFFKSYLAHGLDERGKYLFSLTQGLEMAKFNTSERPRFVECKETVSAIMADKEVLAQRFGSKGTEAQSVAAFLTLLSEVKEQKVDIFVATGMGKKDAPPAQP